MKEKPGLKEKIVETALDLAAAQGWERVTLRDVAVEAGISLATLHTHIEDKTDILAALGRMIDRQILDSFAQSPHEDETPRDRLFDILMERYELLNKWRPGIVSILRSFCFDPKQAVIACPHLGRSMNWMLEAAGIGTSGVSGAVKVAGLTGLYLKNLRVWKEDESADLSKLMAALDKDLERAEKLAGFLRL
ncbi:MAG: TetR/AcrR family transcriptional regulator [Alphaproteobacteria bacterium]|nr:TetR/AcrR family transcriptional regulator [Alphaproteobacteria bacterium]